MVMLMVSVSSLTDGELANWTLVVAGDDGLLGLPTSAGLAVA